MSTKTNTKKIEEAKQKATKLAAEAWSAQEMIIGGNMAKICWRGRMHRAIRRLAEAPTQNERSALSSAINQLNEASRKAHNDAEQAIAEYCALVVADGMQPENLYPVECNCDGCKASGKFHRIASAQAVMHNAMWSLFCDDAEGDTPFLTLMRNAADAGQRDLLWRHLATIQHAMEDYRKAHIEHGEKVEWPFII